ncbi:hypothetical protein Q3G72_021135 [Acer saccharum]|nr:hypothetical protein Q3G72_021135 [Acer saccharum]
MAVSNLEYSSQFDHTPFYREENVYFLCKKLCANGVADADGSDLYVVFISNEKKQAYPTVASKGKQESRWCYSLGLSCCLHSGFSVSCMLRYSSVFSHMIRRHMKDPAGNWIAEPPSYEPIVAGDKNVHNLNVYIEIRAEDISTNVGAELINGVSNKKLGVAMNENQLEEFFSKSLNEFLVFLVCSWFWDFLSCYVC